MVVARGRKSLVFATSTTFLSNIPLVAFAKLDVGANFLIQGALNLNQLLVILLNGLQNIGSDKISTVQQLLKHLFEA